MYLELILLLVPIVVCLDYWKRKRTNDIIKASGYPQVRYTLPIVGDILPFLGKDIKDCLNLFKTMRDNYGKVVCVWSLYNCIMLIQDVKYFEFVLSNRHLTTKSFFYDMLATWLGNGLLLSNGSKWHKRRKIFTPTFHFKILEQFVEIFEQQSQVMVQRLEHVADGQTAVDIFPIVGMAALDIIAESAMGVKINAQSNAEVPYAKALTSAIHIASDRSMKPLQYSEFGFMICDPKKYFTYKKNIQAMHDFTKTIISERKRTILKSAREQSHNSKDDFDTSDVGLKKRMNFLDVLLQSTIDGQPLTDADIQEEVDTFTFEGHDTTTSGLSFTLYMLSRHPEVQARVHHEIVKVLGQDRKKPLTIGDLNELKYMECVIKESLRLYPPVPMIGRVATEDTKIGDKIIPAHTSISLSIYDLGRDPECFVDPETFRPERFAAAGSAQINPYAFVPFSAGPRNCIGQKFAMLEMKAVISCVLGHYELLALGCDIQPVVSIVLRSTTGVNMGLKRRSFKEEFGRV